MFIERKINTATNKIELWKCEWENRPGQPARKVFIEKYADEQTITLEHNEACIESPAICWSYGRTIGNIAVYSPSILGHFKNKSGNDAILSCDIVASGKFRHGAARWYCRTHQSYWGTMADQQSFAQSGVMKCANNQQLMSYQVDPYKLNINSNAEVGIWCSMPPAISTEKIEKRHPKIHVHVRPIAGGDKTIDRDFNAMSISYSNTQKLFGSDEIAYVNITPPAAYEFVDSLEHGRETDCINCSKCGYPHLDLGDFGLKPHSKHFCGNCGFDNTRSRTPIISTPLKLLHDAFAQTQNFIEPDRILNLDEYKGCDYTIWASTPAIIWTANRPQEIGIHVHVVNKDKSKIEDNTFSKVILNGILLSRKELLEKMQSQTIT